MKRLSAFAIALVLIFLVSCGSEEVSFDETSEFSEETSEESFEETSEEVSEEKVYDLPDVIEENFDEDFGNKAQYAKNAFVFSSDRGLIYLSGEFDGSLFPASITKLYTAYVALTYLDPEETLVVGRERLLVALDSSTAGLDIGMTMDVESFIAAMMLPSGNDAAYTVAAAAGRKILGRGGVNAKEEINAFMDAVNIQATLDGLTNTVFVTPDGYHDDRHYTSMHDLLRIAYLVKDNETIMKYTSLPYFEVMPENYVSEGFEGLKWGNTNYLINPNSKYYREGVFGLKTGGTSKAGQCVLIMGMNGDELLVIGVFGCDTYVHRFEDATALWDVAVGIYVEPVESESAA